MLTRNETSLGSNPCRHLGMNSVYVTGMANWVHNGARRNFHAGQGTVIAGNSIAETAAFPNGYEPPYSWMLAIKGGGLSAYNTIYGTGSVSLTSLSLGKALAADLTGGGTISDATLSLIVQLAAAMVGSGTISSASLQAIAGLSAALTGGGDISAAALSLIVSLESDLTGGGTLEAALRGTADMSADIVVTGSGLTTANVGSAVWTTIIESGYTAAEVLRILAAVAAGQTTIVDLGGGAATVTFRDLGDTKDRVEATMASSERATVVLDET